jgi:hypothetical protein
MTYKIIEVTDKAKARQFHEVMRLLYRNDPNFICPLDSAIEAVFTPAKNIFFTHGKAIRWYMEDENGRLAGRVAAYINDKKAYTFQQPTGGMGFFECINNREAATLLFDTARKWNEEQGMKAMDGPINFGENDIWWGLLVKGFQPASYGMNYNPPYYLQLFEDYGFTNYFEQTTNILDLTIPFPERFWKIANWVRQKPEYKFKHFDLHDSEKFINDFVTVYNDGWQFHENFQPMVPQEIRLLLDSLKGILEPEFIWFAYHGDDPIAFEVMVPDVNQLLQYMNGKPTWWKKLRIGIIGKNNILTRTRILVMGVVPKFQKSGIESGLFWHMNEVMKKFPKYTQVELSWVGDFNPKMIQLHEATGSKFYKLHYTMRKLFDESAKITRSTTIPVNTRDLTLS